MPGVGRLLRTDKAEMAVGFMCLPMAFFGLFFAGCFCARIPEILTTGSAESAEIPDFLRCYVKRADFALGIPPVDSMEGEPVISDQLIVGPLPMQNVKCKMQSDSGGPGIRGSGWAGSGFMCLLVAPVLCYGLGDESVK